MPGHQQWGSLHCGRRHGSGPFDVRVFEAFSISTGISAARESSAELTRRPGQEVVLGVRAEDGSRLSSLLPITSVTANVC